MKRRRGREARERERGTGAPRGAPVRCPPPPPASTHTHTHHSVRGGGPQAVRCRAWRRSRPQPRLSRLPRRPTRRSGNGARRRSTRSRRGSAPRGRASPRRWHPTRGLRRRWTQLRRVGRRCRRRRRRSRTRTGTHASRRTRWPRRRSPPSTEMSARPGRSPRGQRQQPGLRARAPPPRQPRSCSRASARRSEQHDPHARPSATSPPPQSAGWHACDWQRRPRGQLDRHPTEAWPSLQWSHCSSWPSSPARSAGRFAPPRPPRYGAAVPTSPEAASWRARMRTWRATSSPR